MLNFYFRGMCTFVIAVKAT